MGVEKKEVAMKNVEMTIFEKKEELYKKLSKIDKNNKTLCRLRQYLSSCGNAIFGITPVKVGGTGWKIDIK